MLPKIPKDYKNNKEISSSNFTDHYENLISLMAIYLLKLRKLYPAWGTRGVASNVFTLTHVRNT